MCVCVCVCIYNIYKCICIITIYVITYIYNYDWLHNYDWFTLLCGRDQHNIVKQLSSNLRNTKVDLWVIGLYKRKEIIIINDIASENKDGKKEINHGVWKNQGEPALCICRFNQTWIENLLGKKIQKCPKMCQHLFT